jgi:hypothetical protein
MDKIKGTPVRSNHGVAPPFQSVAYAFGRGALCLKRTGVLNMAKSLCRGTIFMPMCVVVSSQRIGLMGPMKVW